MIFHKTVSAGNDFLHIDLAESTFQELDKSRLAKNLCQRQTGPGADGVVYYLVGEQTVDFEIYNRDGSRAELSGNGMAGCSALLLYLNKFQNTVMFNTSVGRRKISLINRENNQFSLLVEIGNADFQNRRFFPFLKEGQFKYDFEGISFYPVSVGNPHVVILSREPSTEKKITRSAKLLSEANIFPKQTNVEVVEYKDPLNCRVFYYERGVGPTFSSSTGSAAVFAILHKINLIQDRLWIQTQGGIIKISGKRKICIENSTKIVYKGILLLS